LYADGSIGRSTNVLIDFKKKLKSIVEEHGTSIIFDSEACERLLAEHLSKQKAAQNILLIAQKEGIPQILHRSGNKSYVALQIKMKKALDDRFNLPDNYGFITQSARFAVNTWAYALDIPIPGNKNRSEPD